MKDDPLPVSPTRVCDHRERLAPSGEIRINYDHGAEAGTTYWRDGPPRETDWRRARLPAPPPLPDEPVVGRLAELQAAAAAGKPAPPCAEPAPFEPVPWEGAAGGDARLRAVVPMLQTGVHLSWAAVSTHVPGRSGRECRDRWLQIC